MFHVFMLVVLAGAPSGIAEGKTGYDTKPACVAKLPETVGKFQAIVAAKGGRVAAATCATEAEMQSLLNPPGESI